MTKRTPIVTAVLVVALSLFALALSGCKREESPTPPPPAAPSIVRTVKLMPPESGENQRIYGHTPDGTLVELQIDFRDGHSETTKFRPDGTVSTKKTTYPYTGVLKNEAEYEADGKSVKSERQFRGTGTLEFTKVKKADGTVETTRYRVDGKRLHSVELKKTDGSFTATYYRTDGKTLWAEARSVSSTETEVKIYDASGKLEQIRTTRTSSYSSTTGFDIVVYRPDGTAAYKQVWSGYSSYYYRSFDLKTVEEYEADGKTVKRQLTMQYNGKDVKEAVAFENGVKKSVRTYRWDGTLEKEEFFDAQGKSTKTENHESSENLRETVDAELIKERAYDDPTLLRPQDFQ